MEIGCEAGGFILAKSICVFVRDVGSYVGDATRRTQPYKGESFGTDSTLARGVMAL
jgi:hypothetical protein